MTRAKSPSARSSSSSSDSDLLHGFDHTTLQTGMPPKASRFFRAPHLKPRHPRRRPGNTMNHLEIPAVLHADTPIEEERREQYGTHAGLLSHETRRMIRLRRPCRTRCRGLRSPHRRGAAWRRSTLGRRRSRSIGAGRAGRDPRCPPRRRRDRGATRA